MFWLHLIRSFADPFDAMDQILVYASLSSLAERFYTPVYTTYKWFLSRMREIMFY